MLPVELRLRNIGSHRNTVLRWANKRVVVITGKKGSGKSTLLKALLWAWYGVFLSDSKDRAKAKWLVSLDATEGGVGIDWLDRGQMYRVERAYSKTAKTHETLAFLAADPTCESGWRSMDEGQDIGQIQESIIQTLGISADLAQSTIILMQGESDKFAKTKPTARRQAIADIGNLTFWDILAEKAKKQSDAETENLAKAEGKRPALVDLASRHPERVDTLTAHHSELTVAQKHQAEAETALRSATEQLAALHVEHAGVRDARTTHTAKAREITEAEVRRDARKTALDETAEQVELLDATGGGWGPGDDSALEAARDTETKTAAEMDGARVRGEIAAEAKRGADKAVEDADRAIQNANAAAALEWERRCNARTMELKNAESAVLVAQHALAEAGRAVDDARARAREEWQHSRSVTDEAVATADSEVFAAGTTVRDANSAIDAATRAAADAWRDSVAKVDGDVLRAEAAKAAATQALADARRDASLLDGVPCGGRTEFSGCQFLQNAIARRDALQDLSSASDVAHLAHSQAAASRSALGTVPPPPMPDVLAPLLASLTSAKERADAAARANAAAVAARDALGTTAPEPSADVLAPLHACVQDARVALNAQEDRVSALRHEVAMLGTKAPPAATDVLAPLQAALTTARADQSLAATNLTGLREIYSAAKTHQENARSARSTLESKRAKSEESVRALVDARAKVAALKDEVARLDIEIAAMATARDALRPAAQWERELDIEVRVLQASIADNTSVRDIAVHAVAQTDSHVRDAGRLVQEAAQAAAGLAVLDAEIDGYRKEVADWLQVRKTCITSQNLVIETILPEAAAATNEMLAELSTTGLTVEYPSQKAVRGGDRVIDEIQIIVRDNVGERPYETYSGGERFELDWTICLGLVRTITRRSGADLRFLALDEGFGTHDPDEAERFADVMLRTTKDFGLVWLMSHVKEIADRIPDRLHVDKGASGSVATWVE